MLPLPVGGLLLNPCWGYRPSHVPLDVLILLLALLWVPHWLTCLAASGLAWPDLDVFHGAIPCLAGKILPVPMDRFLLRGLLPPWAPSSTSAGPCIAFPSYLARLTPSIQLLPYCGWPVFLYWLPSGNCWFATSLICNVFFKAHQIEFDWLMTAENISHCSLKCFLCMMLIIKNQILTIIQIFPSPLILYLSIYFQLRSQLTSIKHLLICHILISLCCTTY